MKEWPSAVRGRYDDVLPGSKGKASCHAPRKPRLNLGCSSSQLNPAIICFHGNVHGHSFCHYNVFRHSPLAFIDQFTLALTSDGIQSLAFDSSIDGSNFNCRFSCCFAVDAFEVEINSNINSNFLLAVGCSATTAIKLLFNYHQATVDFALVKLIRAIRIDFLHAEPKLHDLNVCFTSPQSASSSKEPLLLNPITPTPIQPSRADINTPPQSKTVRQLLFEDQTPLHSSTTDTAAEPPSVIPLLDPSPSTMSKEDDPPTKRHCTSKSHDD
ncbi:hypothetical protein SADUNF_Sadunf18G0072000 [Salix dunnii]|uniref:Uncharacterized protein n=1 Tax=Salix dunnii TaxID=1413687 RepID=A0A835J346_9ROSI|nr:hypothetical protein SADUNF_Sadunf18G0072000 [Salix dunnii]